MTITANLVPMGYITGPFGIKGWVKVKVSTEYSDSLDDYPEVFLGADNDWKSVKIESSFARDGIFHAKFEGVDDRDAAFSLRGKTIAVLREQFPEAEEDEYYWVDLIGLSVVNLEGENLGKVTELMETGANDVLVVKDDGLERLIPFVARHVTKVDLQQKLIIVDWGLDY